VSVFAYVGSRTTRERHAKGEGITVFRVDPGTGALGFVQLVGGLVNPSYLTLSPNGQHLYTVHGDGSDVSAFRIDRESGRLTYLNRQGTEGRNPVHLALDPSGRFLVVANHLGSNLAVLPVQPDGSLGAVCQVVPLSGPLGPHRAEQTQVKPHFNLFDPSGRFVIVPDKGVDRVFSFAFADGRLVPAATPFVATREGAGPRNAVFHPSLPRAYVINELDSSVTTYAFDRETGALRPLQWLPSLPSDFTGNSRAAGIAIDAQGRTLYASNRGHDSLAVFGVDPVSGLLAFNGTTPSGGHTPRFFTLAPGGRHLYALNEGSDSIVRFDVDEKRGALAPSGAPVPCGSPVCMVFSA
jgi:6-phosphogluconolactonase